MMKSVSGILGVLLCSSFLHAAADPPHQSPVRPSPSPSPLVTSCDCSAQCPKEPKLNYKEKKQLLKQFSAALKLERKAFDHRLRLEIRDLKTAQKAKRREWDAREKEARHRFFKEYPKGEDRRMYIQQFMARRQSFLSGQTAGGGQRKAEQDQRRNGLKADQDKRMLQFKDSLMDDRRPPEQLWPKAGM